MDKKASSIKGEKTLRYSTLSRIIGFTIAGAAFLGSSANAALDCTRVSLVGQCTYIGEASNEVIGGNQHLWVYGIDPVTGKVSTLNGTEIRDNGRLSASQQIGMSDNGILLPGGNIPTSTLNNTSAFNNGKVEVIAGGTASVLRFFDNSSLSVTPTDFYTNRPTVHDVKMYHNSTGYMTGGDIFGLELNHDAVAEVASVGVLTPSITGFIDTSFTQVHDALIKDNAKLYLKGGAAVRGVTTLRENAIMNWKWSPLNSGQQTADDIRIDSRNARLFIDSAEASSVFVPNANGAPLVVGNLTNNGIVEFTNSLSNMMPDGRTFANLIVHNLTGNGTFIFRTNIVNQVADKLTVTGSSKGIHRVEINNTGSAQTTGREVIKLIETPDGKANFAMPNFVELGAYVYDLRKTGNDWELYSPGLTGSVDTAGRATSGAVSALSAAGNASANTLNVRYLMNEAETQAMLNRVSELRHTSGHMMDLWGKTYYGKFKSFKDESMDGFSMTYGGVQLGGDVQLLRNTDNRLYLGLFAGYGTSSQKYGSQDTAGYLDGEGSMKSYSGGVYATYVKPTGFYVDGAFKYSRYKNEYTVKDTAHETVVGEGSSNGYSATVEMGQRFFLNQRKDGLYAEPQIQLTYTLHSDSEITNSNGLVTSFDDYHSIVSRLGLLLGYEVKLSNTPVNFYFKNSWLREYSGDANYTFNKFDINELDYNFKGNAWQVGVGVTTQFKKSHTVYLDMENTSADKYNHHRVNAGYRYSF